MGKLSGKLIEASAPEHGESHQIIGRRLRELRELSGLTQAELADKLDIGQTALSHLERRSDIQVSTLRSYVEALGAKLKIDAAFDHTTATALRIRDYFEAYTPDDDQLLFPIFSEEPMPAKRDIVLSIKPKYSALILNGQKKIELRRRFPENVGCGTLAYVYSTSPDRAMIGSISIDWVEKKPLTEIWNKFSKDACISQNEFEEYFSGLESGYALKLGNPRWFSREIGLQELRKRFAFEPPQSFLYAKPILRKALTNERSEISN